MENEHVTGARNAEASKPAVMAARIAEAEMLLLWGYVQPQSLAG